MILFSSLLIISYNHETQIIWENCSDGNSNQTIINLTDFCLLYLLSIDMWLPTVNWYNSFVLNVCWRISYVSFTQIIYVELMVKARGNKRTSYFSILLCTSRYFLVLLGTSRYFLVLLGISWYFSVLLGTSRYFFVLPRYFVVLLGTSSYFLVLLGTSPYFYVLLLTKTEQRSFVIAQ